MRGLETPVRKLRRQVFTEVAKVAYEADAENLNDAIEAIPYKIHQEMFQFTVKAFIVKEQLPLNVFV